MYSVCKAFKVSEAVSVSFKNLDLVVCAFGEAVGVRVIKRVENFYRPVCKCRDTIFEFRYIALQRGKNPVSEYLSPFIRVLALPKVFEYFLKLPRFLRIEIL